jgi:thiol-disulfide isomerase/thioredoxin
MVNCHRPCFSGSFCTWTAAIAAIVLVAGCGQARSQGDGTEKPVAADNKTSPAAAGEVDLKILDFDGIMQLVKSKSQKGKVVVMDAWSTSCAPCLKEFPRLVALHKRHGDRVACISLSFDYEGIGRPEEQREAVLKFLREQGATFDNVLSSDDSDTLYRKFKLASIPAVFVYDRQGNLRKRFDNERIKREADAFTYTDVESLVEELLKDKEE